MLGAYVSCLSYNNETWKISRRPHQTDKWLPKIQKEVTAYSGFGLEPLTSHNCCTPLYYNYHKPQSPALDAAAGDFIILNLLPTAVRLLLLGWSKSGDWGKVSGYLRTTLALTPVILRLKLEVNESYARKLCDVRASEAVHSLHFMQLYVRVRYVDGYLEY